MLLTGRMLLCVRERPSSESQNHSSLQRQFSHGHSQKYEDGGSGSGTRISHFLPTSRRIVQFSNGKVLFSYTFLTLLRRHCHMTHVNQSSFLSNFMSPLCVFLVLQLWTWRSPHFLFGWLFRKPYLLSKCSFFPVEVGWVMCMGLSICYLQSTVLPAKVLAGIIGAGDF